jgi:hypothetical protein
MITGRLLSTCSNVNRSVANEIVHCTLLRASCRSEHNRCAALEMYFEDPRSNWNSNFIMRAFGGVRDLGGDSDHSGRFWLGMPSQPYPLESRTKTTLGFKLVKDNSRFDLYRTYSTAESGPSSSTVRCSFGSNIMIFLTIVPNFESWYY